MNKIPKFYLNSISSIDQTIFENKEIRAKSIFFFIEIIAFELYCFYLKSYELIVYWIFYEFQEWLHSDTLMLKNWFFLSVYTRNFSLKFNDNDAHLVFFPKQLYCIECKFHQKMFELTNQIETFISIEKNNKQDVLIKAHHFPWIELWISNLNIWIWKVDRGYIILMRSLHFSFGNILCAIMMKGNK